MDKDPQCNEQILIEKFTKLTVKKGRYARKADLLKECDKSLEDFNEIFERVSDLKAQFWLNTFEETMFTLAESEEYQNYPVRDKMLAFYYTWLEELKPYRDYILFVFRQKALYRVLPAQMKTFSDAFGSYTQTLAEQGIQTGEIAKRPFIGKRMNKILELKLIFILRYWINDNSTDFAKTDTAIDKSVHLAFDILSPGALYSAYDFGKFLFKNKIRTRFFK